ncbi:hypothetical protein AAFF_G00210780 [Aldrovandia affinis]|uniref:HAT C-terminal dimerisation domain-containing protein n=1 Tax=Aldrovandia affinis TaxID=143900 RepID=A0AAD7WUT2_9TELE|nr:hypothetical protein AAFF_G00210780 [Aldrovandia affinis]
MKAAGNLVSLVRELQKSLKLCFRGVFVNVKIDHCDEQAGDIPFGHNVYMLSALLDPSFCLFWLEHDVLASEEVKLGVKESLIDHVVSEAHKVPMDAAAAEIENNEEPQEEPPAKTPRLFSNYNKTNKRDGSTARGEVLWYIQAVSSEDQLDCLDFWRSHRKDFPRLYQVAARMLYVPATSAPVERVFSHGCLIIWPHRARTLAN